MKTLTSLLLVMLSSSTLAQRITTISVPSAQRLSKTDPQAARALLESMGVKYLWKMDGSDVIVNGSEITVTDFMDHSIARGPSDLVTVQTCPSSGDDFVLFSRPNPDYPVGGSLLVQEDFPHSRLEHTSEFTIGGWFKQYPALFSDFRYLEPRYLAGGYMPALSRYLPASATEDSGMEWMAHLTSERLYFNINRGFTGQNDMNQQLPWWADTYGTCYDGRHFECWHYVSISVNPAQNTVQFVIVRQSAGRGYNRDGNDFISTGITDARLNNTPIPVLRGAELRIGAHQTGGTHGIIRGLYFARKALSPSESKALADYTAPSKKGFLCSGARLQPRTGGNSTP